ncbi:unnamed protein product [Ostreobium quekettii]|uniref:Zinc/iron permease n=1 Tax=Ostreobium quekettii TaxID=121088 RepID=A0A8S1IPK3_9CHLO|nr:unnamed protein product [Ostreobium quekettii]
MCFGDVEHHLRVFLPFRQVLQKPDDKLLSLLLGLAIGVMASLSIAQLYLESAIRLGLVPVTVVFGFGAASYYALHSYFPVIDKLSLQADQDDDTAQMLESIVINEVESKGTNGPAHLRSNSSASVTDTVAVTTNPVSPVHTRRGSTIGTRPMNLSSSELWRLGLLMSFTMTLHNLPEGFAVAFTALSDVGPIVAASIALHNIPEGIIVAAPIFAATGSRCKAFAMAFASGMSEPFGAFLALLLAGPILTPNRLDYMLAYVGGVMVAVCTFELWPEARKCGDDIKMYQGIGLGAIVIGLTLYVGT